MLTILNILIALLLSLDLFAICQRSQEGLFYNDYCKIRCGKKIHTLCDVRNHTRRTCNLRRRFNKEDAEFMNKQLIIGHNGLRNRIAYIMRVANMAELVWNSELELMAKRYIVECQPFETDPCTTMQQPNATAMKYGFLYDNTTDGYRYIAQNRYFEDNVHYPSLLIENALRNWYYEKDSMKRPYSVYDINLLSRVTYLEGDNNFTHLAAPEVFYFGCAFNKVYQGFLLICNYYPYVRMPSGKNLFIKGTPGSMCPLERPLGKRRDYYNSLCSGMNRTYGLSSKLYRNFTLVTFILCGYIMVHIAVVTCVYFCK